MADFAEYGGTIAFMPSRRREARGNKILQHEKTGGGACPADCLCGRLS